MVYFCKWVFWAGILYFDHDTHPQTLYERWSLAAYNVAFTFFPVILFGLQNRDLKDEIVMANPQLYISGQRKHYVLNDLLSII